VGAIEEEWKIIEVTGRKAKGKETTRKTKT
jgi:hypothetical protein